MEAKQEKWNFKKIIWGIVSFFIPFIGIIFFFVKKKDNLSMAKFVLYSAIAGLALNIINYCSSDSDSSYNEGYESSYNSNNENLNENTELKNVLEKIAGTYEIYENRGVQGLHTWCILKINSDGTGVKIEEDGTRTNILSSHLNSDNTISFSLSDGTGERYKYSVLFSGSLDLINPRMYNGLVIDGIRKR